MKFYKKGIHIYQRGIGDNLYHRIGDENTFNKLYGDFVANEIIERDIAEEAIGEALFLGGSFLKVIVEFFSKLKGKKGGK